MNNTQHKLVNANSYEKFPAFIHDVFLGITSQTLEHVDAHKSKKINPHGFEFSVVYDSNHIGTVNMK